MKRSLENQKKNLLNQNKKPKNFFIPRGSKVLLNNKNVIHKSSIINFVGLFIGWILISFVLFYSLFESISALLGLILFGALLIFLIKNIFLKQDIHAIKYIEEKKTLEELIEESTSRINDELSKEINIIIKDLNYLMTFIDKSIFTLENEHYIKKCKEKHLVDLLNYLNSAHVDNLSNTQNEILKQMVFIKNNLKQIIDSIKDVIDIKIKIKSVFKPD